MRAFSKFLDVSYLQFSGLQLSFHPCTYSCPDPGLSLLQLVAAVEDLSGQTAQAGACGPLSSCFSFFILFSCLWMPLSPRGSRQGMLQGMQSQGRSPSIAGHGLSSRLPFCGQSGQRLRSPAPRLPRGCPLGVSCLSQAVLRPGASSLPAALCSSIVLAFGVSRGGNLFETLVAAHHLQNPSVCPAVLALPPWGVSSSVPCTPRIAFLSAVWRDLAKLWQVGPSSSSSCAFSLGLLGSGVGELAHVETPRCQKGLFQAQFLVPCGLLTFPVAVPAFLPPWLAAG